MKKNAAIYARVSSLKQKEGDNIQSQVSALIEFANKESYVIPTGWTFTDEGYSGSILQRPALDELRELIQEGDVDTVLVYSPDRLSRKYAYQLILEMEFQKKHVDLVFLNTPKAKNPEEQLSLHFKSIFAEYERAQIAERCRRGRNHRAKQGSVSVIPTAPLGYDYITKKEGVLAHYVINNDAIIVRKIFSYYTEQHFSISKICRQLELDGILSPKGQNKWCTSTVRDILKNETYIGVAHFGKTERCEGVPGRIHRTSKGERRLTAVNASKIRPKEFWIPISVPSIISEHVFETAQHKLIENIKKSSRNTREPSILQGLLVCGYCGGSYYKKKRSAKYSYYGCGRRLNGYNCQAPSVKQEELDRIVWTHIIELLQNPRLIEEEMIRRSLENQDVKKVEESIRELEKELIKIAKARNKLLDAYQEGESLTLVELKTRLKNLDIRQQSALKQKKTLENLKFNEQQAQNMKLQLEDLRLEMQNSSNLSIKNKQSVLRLLISEIVIKGNEVEIKHCIPCGDIKSVDFSPLCSDGYTGLTGLKI
ncbi:MAG: recombinase family protein [Candidatus Babeliales bacterium]|jgi:site-specific DNA recombinase